jgi:hypothetical protein
MTRWMLPLLLAEPALAHRPGELGTVVEVSDPTISWTLASAFEDGDEVFTLHLNYEEPFAAPFEILVPARPAYAVVAPGLPAPSEEEQALLPDALPEGYGAYVEWNDDEERYAYFEGVLRRSLWSSGTVALALPAGETEVWIWSPDGATGEFQFAFGVEENFEDGAWGPLFDSWGKFAW